MDRFLSDLAESNAFWLGIGLGSAALVIGWAVAAASRKSPQPPIGGLLFSTAALFVLWSQFDLPLAVVGGCAAMIGGVMLGSEVWDRALGALPGAAVVVYLGGTTIRGALGIVILTAVCAGLTVDFDAAFRRSAIGLPLLAGSVVGLVVTVPDTERAFALLGVALPLVFLGWPRPFVSLGPGAAGAVGLIGWVAGPAGTSRPGAAIGAITSLGLMLGEPIGRRLAGGRPTALARLAAAGPIRSLAVVAIHGVLVFGAARIAGLREGAGIALLLAAPFIALGALLGAAPDARRPAPAEPPT